MAFLKEQKLGLGVGLALGVASMGGAWFGTKQRKKDKDAMIAEARKQICLMEDGSTLDFDELQKRALDSASREQMPKKSLSKKVNAYIQQLSHPDEVYQLYRYLSSQPDPSNKLKREGDEAYCFDVLAKVSRSFAMVIEGLTDDLRTPICVFYLVLRALDTVEDDMSIPEDRKKVMLGAFAGRLRNADTCAEGFESGVIGDTDDYRDLLKNFDRVVRVMHTLSEAHQKVIVDITHRMAEGMSTFVGKESLETIVEYDLYCHYVAGLVGIGLSQMFAAAESEGAHMGEPEVIKTSNLMGLFLQKTNITRDYLEDVLEGRPWWPKEVWSKYTPAGVDGQARDLKVSGNEQAALGCLHELIADALELAPFCLSYMAKLQNKNVFAFCAVPQVMAIATLAEMYGNHGVFTGVVKIRKGLALLLMEQAKDWQSVHAIFIRFAKEIREKVDPKAPGAMRTIMAIQKILDYDEPTHIPVKGDPTQTEAMSANGAVVFPATAWCCKPAQVVRTYPEYNADDAKTWFMEICDQLIVEVQEELAVFDLKQYEQEWVDKMLKYNVKGGKMNRGLMVVESAKELFKHKGIEMTSQDMGRFAVLGWCIEWMQAWLLIADDYMDSSETRRGQPCWYKQPHVKEIALNDAFTLEMLVFKMLKRHFGQEDYYVQLVDLFQETTWETECGQMLDTLCMNLELKDFTLDRWTQIVQYKTSYYSFYCPVALGMIVGGVKDVKAYDAAREILVTMGIYFQAQDDFLDCYGTKEQIGKIGTDIQDKKCGWLFVHAYHHLCNAEQKALLDKHYGKCKAQSEEEALIKELYIELDLETLYHDYEQKSHDQVMNMKGVIENQGILPWSIFEIFLKKVYKRDK